MTGSQTPGAPVAIAPGRRARPVNCILIKRKGYSNMAKKKPIDFAGLTLPPDFPLGPPPDIPPPPEPEKKILEKDVEASVKKSCIFNQLPKDKIQQLKTSRT